ncbi:MAG TPA: response regulator [Anaerolineales bacterium]|nr:response regulator [Anaerolineales bacterium]
MKRLKILIVEDEKNLARTLAQALRLGSEGRYDVEVTGSAEQAHPLLDANTYDVVISDLRLPGEDGLSLITHAKENAPETHTILMTGYGSDEVEAQADKMTEGYLTKPFDMLDLLLMVQKVISPEPKTNGHAIKQDDLEKNKNRRILILEDDLGLRRIYTKALKKSHYDVDEAPSLQAARKLLNRFDYEIFICDIHVGRERGTDLLEEFKEKFDQVGTQVVMCSAYGQYRYLTEEMGADYFLEKPISLGTLLTLITRLMDASPNAAVA